MFPKYFVIKTGVLKFFSPFPAFSFTRNFSFYVLVMIFSFSRRFSDKLRNLSSITLLIPL